MGSLVGDVGARVGSHLYCIKNHSKERHLYRPLVVDIQYGDLVWCRPGLLSKLLLLGHQKMSPSLNDSQNEHK